MRSSLKWKSVFYINDKFVYKNKFLSLMSNLKSKRKANKIIINRLAAVLKEEGVTDFSKYAVNASESLMKDIFLDW